MLHLFNIFRENKDSDNCAKMLEEECNKMFGIQSLNDEHDCNVVSMNSLNIHSTNVATRPQTVGSLCISVIPGSVMLTRIVLEDL